MLQVFHINNAFRKLHCSERLDMARLATSLVILSVFLVILSTTMALPLSTSSRWIVDDENGERVKLACVNWVSHLEVLLAEGLSKQPLDAVSKKIVDMGFNCVRLTWPLFLVTNESLASMTVRQSFKGLGLLESIAGLQANNPAILDLPLIQAYKAVVANLGQNNIMVVLDNHISKPGWCCSNTDGNGFFGDKYFDPDLWVQGLTLMATMSNNFSNVIGMSLRNELRGPKQNANDWFRYMQRGAEAVHSSNPNLLVILSGLDYDKDFSFLQKTPLNVTFSNKIVFEIHWYAFSDGSSWASGNPNDVCGRVVSSVMRRAGFLLDKGYPLFVSEFGVDLRGTNVNDNRYLGCFMGLAAELDLDFALWTLVGSYYLRQGTIGLDEVYGVLSWNWCNLRNSTFSDIISSIQAPFQGPGLAEVTPYKIIYHPSTGKCLIGDSFLEPLRLGPCGDSDHWTYTSQQNLLIRGTYFCIKADKPGQPVQLSIICSEAGAKWDQISESKMHLASKLGRGDQVCLDVDSSDMIVSSACECLSRDNSCDPASQWFKLVTSTRSLGRFESLPSANLVLDS
uniref:Glycoside hydrolase family 5 domain-containing protein n=1 Tax=Kalanchoe fedtschenkoi TaxID=63787 RepID=A0A7N0TEU3_KALFE